MLGVAFGIGVLLALAGGTAAQGCVAPHHLVLKMVQRLEESVNVQEPPNPSVLLALNLAGATDSTTYKWLLQEIQEEAVKRAQKGTEGQGRGGTPAVAPGPGRALARARGARSRPPAHPGCSLVPADMTSGEVALYVLALLSSCRDPRHVEALGQTVDLLRVLQQKTDVEVAHLGTPGREGGRGVPGEAFPPPTARSPVSSPHFAEVEGIPKTTLYSVSLDTLGLCLTGVGNYQKAAVLLAKQVLNAKKHLSVDTRAVAVLALVCTYNRTEQQNVQELLRKALSTVTKGFLNEQEKNDGMIGNIYSMGLALQALEATAKFYAPQKWDCAQAFSVVYRHDYRQPMAIAQVLPALVGRSYLAAASLDCTTSASVSPGPQQSPSPKLDAPKVDRGTAVPTWSPSRPRGDGAPRPLLPCAPWHRAGCPPCPSALPAALITVHYAIVNKLQGKHFSYAISVRVPDGSTLLKVLQVAEQEKPNVFSFRTEYTSWGPMVVSIHGLAANPDDRTYWQFLSGSDALQEGVGTYKPQDGEHIRAVFSTY
ncbi:cobalamin binding intrinsic factor [Ciconia maguari]